MPLEDEGKRHICVYRENPMYVFVGEKSMSISMVALSAEEHTLEMLDIIAKVTTLALDAGVSKEIISGAVWECQRRSGSLGDTLSEVLIK